MRISRKQRRERMAQVELTIQHATETARTSPDPEAVRALQEYERARRRVSQQILEPEADEFVFSCTKHNWGIRDGVKPAPPAGLCPYCRAERVPDSGGTTVYIDGTPPRSIPLSERATEAVALWEDRQRSDGRVIPGSSAEERALEQIDSARNEELQRGAGIAYVRHSGANGYVKIRRRPIKPGRAMHTSPNESYFALKV